MTGPSKFETLIEALSGKYNSQIVQAVAISFFGVKANFEIEVAQLREFAIRFCYGNISANDIARLTEETNDRVFSRLVYLFTLYVFSPIISSITYIEDDNQIDQKLLHLTVSNIKSSFLPSFYEAKETRHGLIKVLGLLSHYLKEKRNEY